MKNFVKYCFSFAVALTLLSFVWGTHHNLVYTPARTFFTMAQDSAAKDTTPDLPYPFKDRSTDKYSGGRYDDSPFYLKDPSNVKTKVEYDPKEKHYNINESIGKSFYRNPSYLTMDEYIKNEYDKSTTNYWRKKSSDDNKFNQKKPILPRIFVGGEVFDRIFGGNSVEIKPQGSAELTFGMNTNFNNNPAIPEKQRTITTFDFKEKIQLNVIANIGDKLKLTTNYNTEATFDFENQLKIEYTGYEDEIIKKIEAGNVNLPLNSSLISGSQSLFGVKTQLQFGRLTVTNVFSQQKGKSSTIESTGGAQVTKFDFSADNYEANKHFFLSQYFYDNYDNFLSALPIVKSPVIINKVEVWITSSTPSATDSRNILAFQDLGEGNPFAATSADLFPFTKDAFPDNGANALYSNLTGKYVGYRDFKNAPNILVDKMQISRDFERIENARRLNPNEFTFNPRLGYITINSQLRSDDVLAVAFEYTVGDKRYHVGEFSTTGVQAPNALYLKLLKGKLIDTRIPLWNLMMKNIYNLNAYQVNSRDFKLNVMYYDNSVGSRINYIPEGPNKGVPLIRLLALDRLNAVQAPSPDGVFDFVEGITINSSTGRVIFPVTQPFGKFLDKQLGPELAQKYSFDTLYTSTQITAKQIPSKDKYYLVGSYQSSNSSEISLNALNIPQGSVVVTAGGRKLTETVDYTVDYNLGRVKIINEGILQSGAPIKITTESNSLFSVQTKSLLGTRFDYLVNKDFTLGGTWLNLSERPLTKKVNINDEPINNTILGLDGNYRRDSRFITKLVDKIPFIDTKEVSSFSLSGEVADLIPGHATAIGSGSSATAYIDDFEGSKTPLDMRSPLQWYLASTPQGQHGLFPEGEVKYNNNRKVNYNRARLAWYTIDPIFSRSSTNTPAYLDNPDIRSDHYIREIPENEVFKFKDKVNGQTISPPTFNLSFYPSERGPYNYDSRPSEVSRGLDVNGKLQSPTTRWGGITRKLEPTDFDAANIEFIEFWVMDPFIKDVNHTGKGGDLYFNLGNISEDVLRDNKKSVENGLPPFGDPSGNLTSTTAWGKVPTVQPVANGFELDDNARRAQDVGLDGIPSGGDKNNPNVEAGFFRGFVDSASSVVSPTAMEQILADPSADDFHYFRGDDYDAAQLGVLQRYKRYNGQEGNSLTSGASSTPIPDNEDINKDNTLDLAESYFQYHVSLRPADLTTIGKNHLTSIVNSLAPLENSNSPVPVTWYQFRIPVRKPEQTIGGIQDFKSIRFLRMFLKDYQDSAILRFEKLQLVRDEWRRYQDNLLGPGEHLGDNDNFDRTNFDLSTVNLDEDGARTGSPTSVGIPYRIPPGIDREVLQTQTSAQKLNEQSLSLKVCGLKDGDARAGYKNLQLDLRNYKHLKMFVHAQKVLTSDILATGDLTCFVRLGGDFTDNYYEIEVPLKPTPDFSQNDYEIWPSENEIDMDFASMQDVKNRRNSLGLKQDVPYSAAVGKYNVTVKGVPNLANVRTVMIGVRNPSKTGNEGDDGREKCAEVWVDELRMTDFNETGGWAATGRVSAKLADFAQVNFSGSHYTPGWGALEQKLNERKKEENTQYDINSSIELGKFLPEKTGLKIPMYVGYSQSVTTPEYNPLDPDVKLKPYLESLPAKQATDLANITLDQTYRKSINFTNVRKVKMGSGKNHFYDVENLTLSYAYSEATHSSINVESNIFKTYRGGIGYNYNLTPKNIAPLTNLKVKSRYLKPITDFNFYYAPSLIAFRTDFDRQYTRDVQRDVTSEVRILPTYNKIFTLNHYYDLKYDLTKSIKLDFSAVNNATIDEPIGDVNSKLKEDTLRNNILGFGRTTKYHHTMKADYTVPLNKFPVTDWLGLSIRYSADFDWAGAPPGYTLGNTIQNANQVQYTAPINLGTLFNKIKYIQNLNSKFQARPADKSVAPKKPLKGIGLDTAKVKKKEPEFKGPNAFDYVLRFVTSLKSVQANYSVTNGTLLPGYNEASHLLGQNFNANGNGSDFSGPAPGWGFIAGQQHSFDSQDNIRRVSARNGWLNENDFLNNSFTQTHTEALTFRGNMEPLPGLKIDLNASQNRSLNQQSIFRHDSSSGPGNSINGFRDFNPVTSGNYSISFLSISTAFTSDNADHSSPVFTTFVGNLKAVANRVAAQNRNSQGRDSLGFPLGYSRQSQEVLIPAFIAAYSGKRAGDVSLNPLSQFPLPNWRITYDGLSRVKVLQRYVNTIAIGHGYRSNYSVNSYSSNINYSDSARGQTTDFLSRYDYGTVTISEQFSPMVSVDIAWKNNFTSRVEYKKDRTVALSLSNSQVTETRGQEYVGGVGYRVKNFKLPFRINGNQIVLKNDLNFKVDISYRLNNTIIRKVAEETNQPSAGTNILTLKNSIDYVVNERLNARLFYDKVINTPVVSTSFPTSSTQFGVSLRFTLSQ